MLYAPAALSLKAIVLGDLKVGKSTLLQRWASLIPKQGYRATIDADFVGDFIPITCNISSSNNNNDVVGENTPISVRLKILDTPGRKDFQVVSCPLFRGANFLILVFNSETTFERIVDLLDDFRLNMWGQDGKSKHADSFPVFLIDARFDEICLTPPIAVEKPRWKIKAFARDHNIWATYSLSPMLDSTQRLHAILNDIVGRVLGEVLPDTDEARRCRLLMYARTLLFAPPSSSLSTESIRTVAVYQMALSWIGTEQYALALHQVQFIIQWAQTKETLGQTKEKFLDCVLKSTSSNSPFPFSKQEKQKECLLI